MGRDVQIRAQHAAPAVDLRLERLRPAALEKFLAPLEILPFGMDAVWVYGQVRAALEHAGTPIGSLDTLIAAHALAGKLTLITNNLREFERVHGLRCENWVNL